MTEDNGEVKSQDPPRHGKLYEAIGWNFLGPLVLPPELGHLRPPDELPSGRGYSTYSTGERCVFGYLYNCSSEYGTFMDTLHGVARSVGVGWTSVYQYLKGFEAEGWFEIDWPRTSAGGAGAFSLQWLRGLRWYPPADYEDDEGEPYEAMSYREYLVSPEWQVKRKAALKRAGYHCQVCNAGNTILDTHHRTYERLGKEEDADLIVLCRDCHQLFHENGRLAR